MPVHKLTQSYVTSLTPEAKPTIVFDSELKGFGVRILPSGKMTWILEYRPNGGGRSVAKRRLSLAPVDDATSALQARQMAKDTLAKVRMGEDPAGALSAARKAETVADVCATFMRDHVKQHRKPATIYVYDLIFRTYVNPAIGTKKAIDVTKTDIERLRQRIRNSANKQTTANRVVTVLSAAFSWAGQNNIVPAEHNPCRKITKFKERARERFLSDAEIARLWAALESDSKSLQR